MPLINDKNSNRPAHPLNGMGHHVASSVDYKGLTKREIFAMAAMQGLIGEVFKHDGHELTHAENIARIAIKCADELLRKLG